MDRYSRLAELLRGRQQETQVFFTATFISSEGDTCTVDVDGLILDEVRLKPTTTKTDNKILMTPAKGTEVLIGSFSGDYNNLFVLSADEFESIEITCNGQNVMMLISQLIQTLTTAQIITPLGNGTFDPAVISQLNMIETSFKQIFK